MKHRITFLPFLSLVLMVMFSTNVLAQEAKTYYHQEIDLVKLEQYNIAIIKNSGSYVTGRVISLNKNNLLRKEEHFSKGKREGSYKWWYANGKIGIEGNYLNNLKEGRYSTWYSDGRLKSIEFYHMGELEGNPKYWDRHGKAITEPLPE
ncbi:MAG: toxin-antitoxin system YwqK family antitoxin [Flavobacteriaceae bacterium]